MKIINVFWIVTNNKLKTFGNKYKKMDRLELLSEMDLFYQTKKNVSLLDYDSVIIGIALFTEAHKIIKSEDLQRICSAYIEHLIFKLRELSYKSYDL